MITGALRSKVDRLWDEFWTGGISNPLSVIEQITYLIFLRRLDERETADARPHLRRNPGKPYHGLFGPDEQPLRWQNFKNLGGEEMLPLVRDKVFAHLAELLAGDLRAAAGLPNVWWGVSVEDREYGLPRVDALRQMPARVRFLSVEPLLEDLGDFDLTGIDWVIVGGESDRRPRPFDPAWAVRLRDRCAAAGVPFFFKQHGGRNKKQAGRILDGRTHDAMPPRSAVPIPPRSVRAELRKEFAAEFGPVPLLTLGVRHPLPTAPGGVG